MMQHSRFQSSSSGGAGQDRNKRPSYTYRLDPSQASARYQWYRKRRRQQTARFMAVLTVLLLIIASLAFGVRWAVASTVTFVRQAKPQAVLNAIHTPAINAASVMPSMAAINTPGTPILQTESEDFSLLQPGLPTDVKPPFAAVGGQLTPVVPLKEDTVLKNELQALFATYSDRFTPHVFFYDPDTDHFVSINGYQSVSAASVIKVPLLWLLFRKIDEGQLSAGTPLLYLDYLRTGGSGTLQYQQANVGIPTFDVARQMIQISDNTCSNMVISNLGNTALVNQQIADLGLTGTHIDNWLPDLDGTNKVSMYDLTTIFYNLYLGTGVSPQSREDMLTILRGTHNRHLMPADLPNTVPIFHKTGDIGSALADAGIVELPNGKSYILAVQVDRPYNDYTARTMIQQASMVIYDHELAAGTVGSKPAAVIPQ